ncbi:MAG: hypothetical protein H0V68_10775 [Actinobacteria bacterium]|nr:hypothetical protein [Actinomycetota bacterium]
MVRVIVAGALVLALVAAGRWLSGRSDDTSKEISRSITTPIDLAARAEAEANVRSAMSAAQVYFADHGTYAGISTPALRGLDAGVSPTVQVFPTAGGYCLTATVRGVTVHNDAPAAGVVDGPC